MLVYDITDLESFQNLNSWLIEIEKNASKNVYKILVGNKCDMESERKVTVEQGKDFAAQYGMKFFETSAKESTNVSDSFIAMTREIIKTANNKKTPTKTANNVVVSSAPSGKSINGKNKKLKDSNNDFSNEDEISDEENKRSSLKRISSKKGFKKNKKLEDEDKINNKDNSSKEQLSVEEKEYNEDSNDKSNSKGEESDKTQKSKKRNLRSKDSKNKINKNRKRLNEESDINDKESDKQEDNETNSKDKIKRDKKRPLSGKKRRGRDRHSKDFDEEESDKNRKRKSIKSKDKLIKRIERIDIFEQFEEPTEKESKKSKKTKKSKASTNTDEYENEDYIIIDNIDKEESSKENKLKYRKKLNKKKIYKKKVTSIGDEDKDNQKGKKPKKFLKDKDIEDEQNKPNKYKIKYLRGKSKDKPEDKRGKLKRKLDKLKLKDGSENESESNKSPIENESENNHYKLDEENVEIEINEEILHKIPKNKKYDLTESASEVEVGSESFIVPYVEPRDHHKKRKLNTEIETDLFNPLNPISPRKPKVKARPSHHFRGSIDAKTCLYHFIHRKKPEYGDWPMYVLGNIPQLGNNNIKDAIKMDEEERNGQKFYSKYVPVQDDKFPFHYRYFFNKNGEIVWLTAPDTFIAHKQFFTLLQNLRNNVISVFDLNIRYLNDVDEQNIWDLRKEQLIQVVLNCGPDVLYFQEITKPQFEYIDDNLGSVYDFVGMYRDSTDRSEKCSISYNKFKYTLNDWGQFWLSSTPSVPGSNDFNNFFPRICTWCTLKQLEGIDFAFFNIHLDHANFEAHMPCVEVALDQINKVLSNFPETQAIFFGGCFYCEIDDPVIDKIKSDGFILVPFENTFHDFAGDADRHWDYLFWKPYHKVDDTSFRFSHSIVDKRGSTINRIKQQYISDHYPYYAEFEIKGSKFDSQSEESEEENSL